MENKNSITFAINNIIMENKLLNRNDFLFLLNNRNEAKEIKGHFLCFLQIAIIERFGQWRFAGCAHNLDEAIQKMDDFCQALTVQFNQHTDIPITDTEDLFGQFAEGEALEYVNISQTINNLLPTDGRTIKELIADGWNPFDLENRNIGPANVIVLAEGGAPYDDHGFAILEVEDLNKHPYKERFAETLIPQAWKGGNWELDWESFSPDDYLSK